MPYEFFHFQIFRDCIPGSIHDLIFIRLNYLKVSLLLHFFMNSATRSRKKTDFAFALKESLQSIFLIFPKQLPYLVGHSHIKFLREVLSKESL